MPGQPTSVTITWQLSNNEALLGYITKLTAPGLPPDLHTSNDGETSFVVTLPEGTPVHQETSAISGGHAVIETHGKDFIVGQLPNPKGLHVVFDPLKFVFTGFTDAPSFGYAASGLNGSYNMVDFTPVQMVEISETTEGGSTTFIPSLSLDGAGDLYVHVTHGDLGDIFTAGPVEIGGTYANSNDPAVDGTGGASVTISNSTN